MQLFRKYLIILGWWLLVAFLFAVGFGMTHDTSYISDPILERAEILIKK